MSEQQRDNRPIGIFDSGLGGLTAVTELAKTLPEERFILPEFLNMVARFRVLTI